jgi:hypothetical protein
MPYTLTLVAEGIRCHYTSNATQSDIAEAIARISAELNAQNMRYVIHDFSQAERLDSGVAAQLSFGFKSSGKVSVGAMQMCAIVTRDEVFSYLIDAFKKHSTHQTKVFSTLAEAEGWVNSTLI